MSTDLALRRARARSTGGPSIRVTRFCQRDRHAHEQSTGVVRTSVTNAEGVFFLPGLDPASTTSSRSCPVPDVGPGARDVGGQYDDHDRLQAALANVTEAVTVRGRSAIEVSQSKVASSIEAKELENLR